MLPVEILPVQESLVLRARGSELLILPHHVKSLKGLTKSRDFSEYFRAEALVNRPARKLFEAWLRKDHTLWQRIYTTIHKQMNLGDQQAQAVAQETGTATSNAVQSATPSNKPVQDSVTAAVEQIAAESKRPSTKGDNNKAKATEGSPAEVLDADAAPKKKTSTKKAEGSKKDSPKSAENPKKKVSTAKKNLDSDEKPAKKTTTKTAGAKKSEPKTTGKANSPAKSKSKG